MKSHETTVTLTIHEIDATPNVRALLEERGLDVTKNFEANWINGGIKYTGYCKICAEADRKAVQATQQPETTNPTKDE